MAVKNYVGPSIQWKSWYTARILCFNRSFKRNCAISTGIPNLGMRCKKWPLLMVTINFYCLTKVI